jgi:iron(III) transport system permease protein
VAPDAPHGRGAAMITAARQQIACRGLEALRRARLAERAPFAAVLVLVAYLALVPLGYLLWHALSAGGSLSIEPIRAAFRRTGIGSMAVSSLVFALGSSGVALVCGTSLAFLTVRTDLPLRRVVFAAALVPLIVPGVLYTIAWIFLASPRTGALESVLPVDPFGMTGMILVEGLHLAPLVLLLMAAALRSMDGTLEEAALMSGAGRLAVLRRVTLPLARPALYATLLVMVLRALESFEVPALLGIPAGTWVFTSRIWQALDGFPADQGRAASYSLPLLAVTLLGVFLYSRLGRRSARYEVVGGRGTPPARLALGRWRLPLAALTWAYLLLAVAAPLGALLYASGQPFFSKPTLHGLSRITGSNYSAIFSDGATARAFGNSLLLSVGTATAVTLVMAAVAWLVVRGRFRGRWLIDALVSLPLVIPGLVLGLALLFVYVRFPVPIYGTLWILFVAYFTRFMPYGMRYAAAAMHQISEDVEEAARTSGATAFQSFRRIMLPLLLPALAAGWLYVVIAAMRELSASLLLYSPGSEVVSVRIFTLYSGGELTQLAALGIVMTALLAALGVAAWRVAVRVRGWPG